MQEVFEKIIHEIMDKMFAIPNEVKEYPMNAGLIEAYEKAIGIVKRVATEYNNGWIPCNEGLPEENMEVIVTISEMDGSNYTSTSWLQDGVWIIKKTPLQPTVIAWQPFPEPYQPKGE